MKINIEFDRNWFFAQEIHLLAVNRLVSLLRSEIDERTEVIEKTLNECTLELPNVKDAAALDRRISDLISERICQDAGA